MSNTDRYKRLKNFLEAWFSDSDIEERSEEEVVSAYWKCSSEAERRVLIGEGTEFLKDHPFRSDILGYWANRHFDNEANAKTWLEELLESLGTENSGVHFTVRPKVEFASSFHSEAVAQTVVAEAVARDRANISQWLRSCLHGSRLCIYYQGASPIGRGRKQGDSAAPLPAPRTQPDPALVRRLETLLAAQAMSKICSFPV